MTSSKKFDWTREENFLLIDIYRSYPELWKSSCSDYRNRTKRLAAIESLAKIFNTTNESINRKIRNMRCQLWQERHKPTSTWEYFNALRFVDFFGKGIIPGKEKVLSKMRISVRSRNPCINRLGYLLFKERGKYIAECSICGIELKNSGTKSLMRHRNVCAPAGKDGDKEDSGLVTDIKSEPLDENSQNADAETTNNNEENPPPTSPKMKMSIRSRNRCIDRLGYKLFRYRGKYTAECSLCGIELKNSATKSLIRHRNICRPGLEAQFGMGSNEVAENADSGVNKVEIKADPADNFPHPIIVAATTTNNDKIDFEQPMEIQCQKNQKIWNNEEMFLFLDFLKNTDYIEKPTAKIYYEMLLERNSSINATWEQCEEKLRNMKYEYLNARARWKNVKGSNVPDLADRCPYYHELDEIFKNMTNINEPHVHERTSLEDFHNTSNIQQETPMDEDLFHQSDISIHEDDELFTLASTSKPFNEVSEGSSQQLATKAQEFRMQFLNQKIKLEEKRLEMEMQLNRDKLLTENEIRREKLALKREKLALQKRKLEFEEKIRLKEIEKAENIAKYEIQMKYKRKTEISWKQLNNGGESDPM